MKSQQTYPVRNAGAVLIFALWTLSFLAVLAMNLAYGIRQNMTFVKRIEDRNQIKHIAQGGIKAAVALLLEDMQRNNYQYTAAAKAFRHNNPARFADIRVGDGASEVSFLSPTDERRLEKYYGFSDEEGKINVNTIDKLVLKKVIGLALAVDEPTATKIAEAIFDWRQPAQSDVKGFYSDDYYANLQFPYPKKSRPFELPDELMLVQGIDHAAYEILRCYLTVYGDGQVNINTASKTVLMALGVDEETADKLLKARRGNDGIDNTIDDHVFERTYDIATEVSALVKLSTEEIHTIDLLNQKGLITTNSSYYMIQSDSMFARSHDHKRIICVVDTRQNRIIYWKEK